MTNRIQRGDLQVSEELDKLITEKVCVNIDLEPAQFWNSFNEIVKEFTPRQGTVVFFQSTPNSYHGVKRFIEKNCPKRFFIYGSYALNKPVIWKFNDIPYYPHIIKTKKKMLTSFHDANYLTVPVAT